MKVKIVYGDDMRRWRYPETNRYESLTKFIKETFNFCNNSSFFIQFEDDENDKVTITSETDFDDAFACAEQENRKSLKIFVNQGPIEQTHSKMSLLTNDRRGHSFEAPVHTGPCGIESTIPGSYDAKEKIEEPDIDESETDEHNCSYWRERAMDFLQNKEIQELLPQFARRVIAALREEQNKMEGCYSNGVENNNKNSNENDNQSVATSKSKLSSKESDEKTNKSNENSQNNEKNENNINKESCADCSNVNNENNNNNSNQNNENNENNENNYEIKDFTTIVTEILSEEQFKPIATHEIYEKKIRCILPCISAKIAMYQHVLLQFNDDAIATYIPNLVQILMRFFMSFENRHFDVEVDPMCHAFLPTWLAFMNTQQAECVGDHDRGDEPVHCGVTCDECNVCPIKGVRYKCTVCDNFDLCAQCEASSKHDETHPLMKFSVRLPHSMSNRFLGLNQIIHWLGGPRSVFHGCPRMARNHKKHGHGHHTRGGPHHGPHGAHPPHHHTGPHGPHPHGYGMRHHHGSHGPFNHPLHGPHGMGHHGPHGPHGGHGPWRPRGRCWDQQTPQGGVHPMNSVNSMNSMNGNSMYNMGGLSSVSSMNSMNSSMQSSDGSRSQWGKCGRGGGSGLNPFASTWNPFQAACNNNNMNYGSNEGGSGGPARIGDIFNSLMSSNMKSCNKNGKNNGKNSKDNCNDNSPNDNKCNKNDNNNQKQPKKAMADFVTDVTLPDRSYYPVDTVLTKTWRMRNAGEKEWGSEVELVFFKGNEALTLQKRYQVRNAQPSEEVEVSAVVKTPQKPGRYCSYYRLQRNGDFFGPRVWVDIFAVDEEGSGNNNCINDNNNNSKNCNNKSKFNKNENSGNSNDKGGKLDGKDKDSNANNNNNNNNNDGVNSGNNGNMDGQLQGEDKNLKKLQKEIRLQQKREEKLGKQQKKISKKIQKMEQRANKIAAKQQKKLQKQRSRDSQQSQHNNNVNNNNNINNNIGNNVNNGNNGNDSQVHAQVQGQMQAQAPYLNAYQLPIPMPVLVHDAHAPQQRRQGPQQQQQRNNNNNNNNIVNNDNNRFEPLPDIMCVCGCPLIRTSPFRAYGAHSAVQCDICSRHCGTHSLIYHCPLEKCPAHQHGYDLCGACADIQMISRKQMTQVTQQPQQVRQVQQAPPQSQPQPQPQPHPPQQVQQMQQVQQVHQVAPQVQQIAQIRQISQPAAQMVQVNAQQVGQVGQQQIHAVPPRHAHVQQGVQQQVQQQVQQIHQHVQQHVQQLGQAVRNVAMQAQGQMQQVQQQVQQRVQGQVQGQAGQVGGGVVPVSPIDLPRSPVIPAPIIEHLEKQEQEALMMDGQNDIRDDIRNDIGNGSDMSLNVDVNDLYDNMDCGPIVTPPPIDDIELKTGDNGNPNINDNNNNNSNNAANSGMGGYANDMIPSAPDMADIAESDTGFAYKSELAQIVEMGVPLDDRVRTLLVKHKGQVNRVVQELFQ